MRQATKDDFKIGSELITLQGDKFTIYSKYADGIWEARGSSGEIVVFESDAKTYKVTL